MSISLADNLNISKSIGALAGIGIFTWAACEYIQPAILNSTDSINKKGADWITAAIALLGGVEISGVAGAAAGMILVGIAACLIHNTPSCRSSSRENTAEESRPLLHKTSATAFP